MSNKGSSQGGRAKIKRAINQLENVERLLAGLPNKTYKENKNFIENARRQVETLATNIDKKLGNTHKLS